VHSLGAYFKSIGSRRLVGMVLGNLIIGVGCGFFKWSSMGNDPFSACGMALSDVTGIAYGPFIVLYNIFYFSFQIFFGRKYIGIGTLVNWFGLGYFTQWTYDFLIRFGEPDTFLSKLFLMILGVLIACLGISFYQTSDTGIAPYDSIALMIHDYFKVPYFWCRMITDVICSAVCFFAGGLLGLGTLVCAFGMGPFIHFFDRHVSEKLLSHHVGDQN